MKMQYNGTGFLHKLDNDDSQVTLINPVTVFTMKKSTSHQNLSSTSTTTYGNGTFTEKLNENQRQHKRPSATTDELRNMLKKLKKSLAIERTLAVEDESYYKSALSSNISL
uniref:Uncharacterized protein n=1 Tax=Romanomermis culicivorax TaxID=13658 RepID=A0A915HQF2_ROMCU